MSKFRGLEAFDRFILYKLVPSKTRSGKIDKIPVNYRDGSGASVTNPSHWGNFNSVQEAANVLGPEYGIGFVFTADLELWFLDIDACLVDGAWSPLAQQLITALAGCAVEVSQSGTGLHIIGRGTLPPHGCRNKSLGLELYHTERFVALTGTHATGDVRHHPGQPVLDWLVTSYFSKGDEPELADDGELTDHPDPAWSGPTDDDALLRRAMMSTSAAGAFGIKATFADLWEGDPVKLSQFYPPDPGSSDVFGRSEADAALAQHLAFWTGKHGTRIQALMLQSGLVRDKWFDREGYYLPKTIRKACGWQHDVLHDKPLETSGSVAAIGHVGEIRNVEGSTFVSTDQQLEFFKGCTYVVSAHRVLTPDGSMLRPEQFRAKYGGFSFPMDHANERVTRNAWECFTESQVFRAPKADATMFRPDLPPGFILNEGGYTRVNSYVPVTVPRQPGDPAPFLNHLAAILPDERDRMIFLSYLAACVQHQGVKFQWAPLIQGTPGNGKTLFTRCLIYAIGERYCHIPSVESLTERFNSWLFDRILIAVEDVYNPENHVDAMDILKPMITGEFLSKRAMQTDQAMQNCVANFIFNSNHKSGLRKDRNDRRLAMFFCLQQRQEDLIRDGLTEDYFVRLYAWLRSGGYAIVSEFLYTFEIPDEFNPAASCQRAPRTTSTEEAIQESLGGVEQEIMEAITRGDIGFRGGFISSQWLAHRLEHMGASRRITHNKRRELLEPLGYVMHPGLSEGRAPRFVLPDGVKSRLFIRKDVEAFGLTDAEAICKAYEAANYSVDK